MKNATKALLLGVDLRYRDDGTSKICDVKRQTRLTKALERLVIHVDELQPETLSQMVDSAEEIIEWLAEHPQARVILSRWQIDIESPNFGDVDHEKHDCPFEHGCAVEDFAKTGKPGLWSCGWSLC